MSNNKYYENNCGCGGQNKEENWEEQSNCFECGNWFEQSNNYVEEVGASDYGECGCEHDGKKQRQAQRELREAICDIQEGIRLACEALRAIQRGSACQAVKLLREAIFFLERGVEELECALKKISRKNCRVDRLIEEAICDIKDGIRHLSEALEDLLDGKCKDAACEIKKGIRVLEDGLRNLCEALEDLV